MHNSNQMNTYRPFFVFVCSILMAGTATPKAGAADDTRPNILVIVADDWSWPHAEPYGQSTVLTPHFNRLAANGVLFHNAFTAAPTCTASRGALLTGKHPHRLEQGANLWSMLPARFLTYPDKLSARGYVAGQSGKGWGPGTLDGTGRTRNPAGPGFASFSAFLRTLPADAPFCYWHGSQDPHRPYEPGSGLKAGLDPKNVSVPPFLPDTPEVRSDLLDYLLEVRRFDNTVGEILAALDASGRAENTLVIVTSDNGMPFPRAKANLYDAGSHVPLVISWPNRIYKRRAINDLVSLVDLAPTILEAAGLAPEPGMTGNSLIGLLTVGKDPISPITGRVQFDRDFVVIERERHAYVRDGGLGYPSRALRMKNALYIQNYKPDRSPAGDAKPISPELGSYGDIDPSPSKDLIVARSKEPGTTRDLFATLAVDPRPSQELYDLAVDQYQIKNLFDIAANGPLLPSLNAKLTRWMIETGDPRAQGETDFWDKAPYVGPRGPKSVRPTLKAADNSLTPLERELGWTLLFDGKTSKGWLADGKKLSKTQVIDGSINPHKAGGYMLVYERPFEDFVLSLDFKISPKCNSGVFLRTWPLEPRPGKDLGFNGIEVAIDDTSTAGFHDTGALYDLVKPARNAMKPVGEWNHLLVVCDGPQIIIEINGQTVTETRLSDWTEPLKRPDGSPHKFDVAYKDHPRRGYVGLQDHGSDCWYKNIKLLELK